MNPGKLNKRISLQSLVITSDSEGVQQSTWIDYKTVWASIEPLSVRYREFLAAQAINTEISVTIKIRYTEGINSAMRVKYGNRFYTIIAVVNPNESNKELNLMCKEVI